MFGRPAAVLALLLSVAACTAPAAPAAETPSDAVPPTGVAAAAAVCDAMPAGPDQPPAGAVRVDPAVDSDLTTKTDANPPGTTFWLAPGRHTFGDDEYGQVIPKDGNTYLGAPGAVLDGRQVNLFAFTQPAASVTVKYLTIENFAAPHDQGVVNHDSGDGWVIEHNTIQRNSGAAMMAGARQRIVGNCLRDNGQYGVNAYSGGNPITGLLLAGNEITGNNTDDWEAQIDGCGCTGGVKFWAVDGADIRGNWVHDNRGVGLWADVNNNDFLIEDNVIDGNDSAAIVYEVSYNAIIRNNTIRRNNWVEGRELASSGDSFPSPAIYLSESGGEPRVPARTDKIDIYQNLLQDNWSGITVWENADRFCNSPANPSDDCTRLVPDHAACAQPGIATEPLRSDCRWRAQRVDIHDNRFLLDPAVPRCETLCGRMGLLANYGSYPDWSPYQGDALQDAVTFDQDNRWRNNSYVGPWTFVVHDTSKVLDETRWRAAPYGQDTGSTFRRGG